MLVWCVACATARLGRISRGLPQPGGNDILGFLPGSLLQKAACLEAGPSWTGKYHLRVVAGLCTAPLTSSLLCGIVAGGFLEITLNSG